jgi:hypothetical protein
MGVACISRDESMLYDNIEIYFVQKSAILGYYRSEITTVYTMIQAQAWRNSLSYKDFVAIGTDYHFKTDVIGNENEAFTEFYDNMKKS